MWHFKTLCGTFWIVPAEQNSDKFYLGVDNDALGAYPSSEAALADINNHKTGCLDWDASSKMNVPTTLESWMHGEPEAWS